jgi:hypothetical protein
MILGRKYIYAVYPDLVVFTHVTPDLLGIYAIYLGCVNRIPVYAYSAYHTWGSLLTWACHH